MLAWTRELFILAARETKNKSNIHAVASQPAAALQQRMYVVECLIKKKSNRAPFGSIWGIGMM